MQSQEDDLQQRQQRIDSLLSKHKADSDAHELAVRDWGSALPSSIHFSRLALDAWMLCARGLDLPASGIPRASVSTPR